ncbi:MAG: ornithine cyclodeaminase family protein [SAR202 cluster bacterium]|nr:ornithine cyclodeaminase family protein [SAR202 cluster bacterium]
MALLLTEKDVAELLTMDIAIETIEEGFRQQAAGQASNSPRLRLPLGKGAFNFMAAAAPGLGVMGMKTYGVFGAGGAKFYVQLYSTENGELMAVIEANTMGQIRTGAASGLATRLMAREDSSDVGIIGSGFQARTQLEAVCRVRDVKTVRVFSRRLERREEFARWAFEALDVSITAVDSAEDCITGSDIAIAITSAASPVIKGAWLKDGAHVNAAGSNHWMRREVDSDTVMRSRVIVTDDVEQAKIECGDLILPVDKGGLRWRQVHELSELVSGAVQGRHDDNDITLFESQGVALEDIAIGIRIVQMAREKGIGREVSL